MNDNVQSTMYKYTDHHEKFSSVHSVISTKFWKYVCPTLFKYHGDSVKTGDYLSLLCRY